MFTWYTRWQFSHTRRPAMRSITMSRGTSRSIATSSGVRPSTRSSSRAWNKVRGNPSSTNPSPNGPPGTRHSSTTPTTISSGTSSPASMNRFASSPNAVPERRLRAEHVARGNVRDVVMLGEPSRLGSLPGALLSQEDKSGRGATRYVPARSLRGEAFGASPPLRFPPTSAGTLRSSASSAGCRSASSFRASRRPR